MWSGGRYVEGRWTDTHEVRRGRDADDYGEVVTTFTGEDGKVRAYELVERLNHA